MSDRGTQPGTPLPKTPLPWAMYDGWGPLKSDGLMRAIRFGGEHPNSGIYSSEFGTDIVGWREDFEYAATACNGYPSLLARCEALTQALRDVLADHEERVSIYGMMETQPNRMRVMGTVRALLSGEAPK